MCFVLLVLWRSVPFTKIPAQTSGDTLPTTDSQVHFFSQTLELWLSGHRGWAERRAALTHSRSRP